MRGLKWYAAAAVGAAAWVGSGSPLASTASAAVLWDNGGFVTNPTGGTGTIGGQPISNADGFTIPGQTFIFSTIGVSAAFSVDTALADDFTVPAGGWDLDAVTLYAIQSSTPSVTRVRINLWAAAPFNANSPAPLPSPLPQPLLTQSLLLNGGPGTFVAHRQSPSGTSTNRPVFAYTVSLDGLPNNGLLDAGTYWLEYSFEGTGTTNVLTPLVTPRASVTRTFNARQYAALSGVTTDPRAWFEGREGFVAGVQDGRAYELPFVLQGTPEPGTAVLALGLAGVLVGRRRAHV